MRSEACTMRLGLPLVFRVPPLYVPDILLQLVLFYARLVQPRFPIFIKQMFVRFQYGIHRKSAVAAEGQNVPIKELMEVCAEHDSVVVAVGASVLYLPNMGGFKHTSVFFSRYQTRSVGVQNKPSKFCVAY